MALFDFGLANEAIVALVKRYGELPKDKLIAKLAWLQVNQMFPICPFSRTKDGAISSEVIARALGNLKGLGYLNSLETPRLTGKGKSIYEGLSDPFPSKIEDYAPCVFPSRKVITQIGDKEFSLKLNACSESSRLSSFLPVSLEMGFLFSMPFEKILKDFLPLGISDKEVALFALERSEKLLAHHPLGSLASENGKVIRHHLHQVMPQYDENKVTALLKILLYSLLPYTNIYDCTWCGKHEERDETKKAADVFTVPQTKICSRCYSKVIERCLVLENPKIVADWSNGAFMDWYVSRQMSEAGLSSAYWFCEVDDKECDVIGFNQHCVVIGECKRIEKYGNEYKKGMCQLNELKKTFDATGLKVFTILITTIAGEPEKEGDVDIVITRLNFPQIKDELLKLVC